MTKFLDIQETGVSESGKTKIYQAINIRTREMAGEIRYRYGCRGYVFFPSTDFFFDHNCLKQIAEFLDELNAAKRKTAKPRQ